MASNYKKNNGGRKTTGNNNSKTAPRHHSTTSDHRATTTPPKSTPTTNPGRGPVTTSTVERKPTEFTRQQIAEAAYFLWRKRGGSEESNWLEAERLLKTGRPVR